MAFTLSAASLAKLVIAHDGPEADPKDLLDPFDTRSEAELSAGLVWFYCTGLAIALASMGIIALSHRTKEIPHAHLSRKFRLCFRFVASLAILLLPLARHRLNSLTLVASTSSIVVSVLLVELIGSTCRGDVFWSEGRVCTYSAHARMTRKELAEKAKTGDVINVEELARKGDQHVLEGIVV